jgi:hypothetical protein
LWRVFIATVAVGLAGWYVALGAANQWDFETYYYATVAFRAGLDPYSLEALSKVAGRAIELPFLYAPVTLLAFVPLTHLPIQVAAGVWLGLKCLVAVAL